MDFFGQPRFHFSFEPPTLSVLATFGSHCILHLEILPILVALHLWPDLLSGTAIFFHVDNEAALHSLVRMSCDNHAADQLVQRMTFDPWIHRVPTEVNVADAPSRGDETQLLFFRFRSPTLHQPFGTVYGASCSCKICLLLYRFVSYACSAHSAHSCLPSHVFVATSVRLCRRLRLLHTVEHSVYRGCVRVLTLACPHPLWPSWGTPSFRV